MRIGTLFSGIGSPEQGASRVYNDLDLVFACEWDKYARQSFKANYDIDDKHFHNDISDMDGTQYKDKVDILIGGSPCQDFSLAGLRAGIDGNKGILIYEYIRIIKEVQPPIFIYENVKGMLSDKGGRTIKDFVQAFRDMGYNCHYEVLNTKDYGVPQNRERVFLVGFKDTEHYYNFSFAPKVKLIKRLKDVLEDCIDDKYYLSDKMINYLSTAKRSVAPGDTNKEYSPTLIATYYKTPTDGFYIKVKTNTKKGYEIATNGDSINISFPNSKTRRGRVGKQVAQTLDCSCNQAVVDYIVCKNIKQSVRNNFIRDYKNIIESDKKVFYSECKSGFQDNKVCLTESACLRANNDNLFTLDNNYKIRKLTPLECFRLQDFPDSFKFVISNSQLYKQSGNSISVNVIEMIFRQIEKSRTQNTNINSLF